ncbi:GH92 family glycosyl hydrolase [Plebeiibacterium marinum]|uniref:GH92 family glycosyl hydrolase n=1 Tax=Plebeiibacterium marinum TaxID=2992111 RepID=A0AAE3MCW6_9BACT|nr:GH92 family glycosyl hydrolase [Plebeiobacterium marinum]MCW3804737.1 GH92 family glycosyl hydrolase [Plebeiobacterium marinum]
MTNRILHIGILWSVLLTLPISLYSQNHKYVDPLIGSEGLGNVFIGPSAPYGMVKPGPDNDVASNSGYSANADKEIYGFSQVHVSGTGGGPKYGNISVMPFSSESDTPSKDQTSLRSDEQVRLAYYNVMLNKWNIQTQITTSDRAAFYHFSYPQGAKRFVKIDLGKFLGEAAIPNPDAREAQQFVGSEIEIVSDTEVRGYSRIRGGWNNGSAYTVYFSAVFDQPISTYSTWKKDKIFSNQKIQIDTGDKTGAILSFDGANDDIQMKIGISFLSPLKARANINNEIPHWDFNQTLSQTQNKWEAVFKRLEVNEDASTELKTMLYTGLYHTMLMPVDRTGENPLWENNGPYYDDFYAIWDTYRSSSPLITLLNPSRQVDIINAMLQIYKRDGYMPDARSGNSNGRTQGGSNGEVVIADAFVKGLQGIKYKVALEAMLKDATVPPGGNEEKEGRGGLTDYNRLGYVSTDFVRAGNRTLEYAYNDYCLAIVAKAIKRRGEYWRFIKQADNWQNLWRDIEDHGSRGFIMPKDAHGNWVDSIQCNAKYGRISYVPYTPVMQDWPICVCWWCGFFYEASSWEYSLSVPHDVAKLVELSGGKEAFQKRLNTLFDKGLYNVANEPSFLSPNLYHWIGRPDLSNDRIHQIIDNNYNISASGIPGNDDSGAMSSWLAFHMIGLYPNAGQSYYLINAPYFKKTTIHQENGNDFIIEAKNLSEQNKYIQSVQLNGVDYTKAFIEHSDIVKGGSLTIIMGSKPSDKWGTELLPPSLSDKEI